MKQKRLLVYCLIFILMSFSIMIGFAGCGGDSGGDSGNNTSSTGGDGGGGSGDDNGGGGGGNNTPSSGDLLWTATSNPSSGTDVAGAVASDSNYIYVVGCSLCDNGSDAKWRIEKRNISDGSLVTSFGTNGVVTSDPSTAWDIAYAIAIDSTYMYVVGHDEETGTGRQWRIEKRNLSDGALVTAFGTGGVITSNPSSAGDYAYAIAIDSTYMYVAGSEYVSAESSYQWRIEKRRLDNGALVTAFDTDGVVQSNPSSNDDAVSNIAIDSNYIYVVGYDKTQGSTNAQGRGEVRNITTGALVNTITFNTTANDEATDIILDSSGIYTIGQVGDGSTATQWRIEKRSLTDGSLITAFGTNGVVNSDPSTGRDDRPNGIAIDSSGIYMAGWASPTSSNDQWRIEKRGLTDGSLITSFGTNGVVTSDPSTGNDEIYGITVDSSAIYAVGFDSTQGNAQWRIEKRVK